MTKTIVICTAFYSVLLFQQPLFAGVFDSISKSISETISEVQPKEGAAKKSSTSNGGGGFFNTITDTLSGGSNQKKTVIGETNSEYWNTYKKNILTGTVVGSAVGGILGATLGGKQGALIGAGAGAITGNLIGKSIAKCVFTKIVTQENSKEIIADNEEKIGQMRESISQLQQQTKILSKATRNITKKYEAGKIDKQMYAREKVALAEKIDLMEKGVAEIELSIQGLEKQIVEAKAKVPGIVPTLEEQLVTMQSYKEIASLNKADTDNMLALM